MSEPRPPACGRGWLRGLACLACVVVLCGCVEAPVPRPEAPPRASAPPRGDAVAPVASVSGRTLIYRVQHGRAEDLAAVLLPIIERRYGRGATVVPLTSSNVILVRLASPGEGRGNPLPFDGRK